MTPHSEMARDFTAHSLVTVLASRIHASGAAHGSRASGSNEEIGYPRNLIGSPSTAHYLGMKRRSITFNSTGNNLGTGCQRFRSRAVPSATERSFSLRDLRPRLRQSVSMVLNLVTTRICPVHPLASPRFFDAASSATTLHS